MTRPQLSVDQAAELRRIAEIYRQAFDVSAPGREALAHLEKRFCSSPAVVTVGGIDAILTTYQRAAHRQLLDFIHAQIARANGEESAVENPEASTT